MSECVFYILLVYKTLIISTIVDTLQKGQSKVCL